jgi:hypothetical protein
LNPRVTRGIVLLLIDIHRRFIPVGSFYSDNRLEADCENHAGFLHIGQETLDPLEIGGVNNPGLSQVSFPLGAFLGEDMAGKGLTADNLAGAGTLEPLGSPSVCFHLRHSVLPFSYLCRQKRTGQYLYVPAKSWQNCDELTKHLGMARQKPPNT